MNRINVVVIVIVATIMSMFAASIYLRMEITKNDCRPAVNMPKSEIVDRCGMPNDQWQAKVNKITRSEWFYENLTVGFYNDKVGYVLLSHRQ
jgi:hypothetical protein